jgi:hypothetical protein
VTTVMNILLPLNAGNFSTSSGRVSCSERTMFHGGSQSVSQLGRHAGSYLVGWLLVWLISYFYSYACAVRQPCHRDSRELRPYLP